MAAEKVNYTHTDSPQDPQEDIYPLDSSQQFSTSSTAEIGSSRVVIGRLLKSSSGTMEAAGNSLELRYRSKVFHQ